jgi:hypothetical protein
VTHAAKRAAVRSRNDEVAQSSRWLCVKGDFPKIYFARCLEIAPLFDLPVY